MASLQGCKIHDMSGSFRLLVPPSWRKRFNVVSKQRLNVIVSNALVVLPPRELSESELEELVRDIKQYVKVANLMKST